MRAYESLRGSRRHLSLVRSVIIAAKIASNGGQKPLLLVLVKLGCSRNFQLLIHADLILLSFLLLSCLFDHQDAPVDRPWIANQLSRSEKLQKPHVNLSLLDLRILRLIRRVDGPRAGNQHICSAGSIGSFLAHARQFMQQNPSPEVLQLQLRFGLPLSAQVMDN